METQQQAGKIHAAICKIMSEVGGVAKTRRNEQQHYQFRGIADVYLACQPLMAAHGVHVVPEEIVSSEVREGTSKSGGVTYHVIQRTRFRAYADDGSSVQIEAIGEAIDSGDKAANKAASAAMKYALVQLFALPEEDPDIDTENSSPDVKTAKTPPPATKDPPIDTSQKAALDTLVKVLRSKGVSGAKDVLAWLSMQVEHNIAKLSDLTRDEYQACHLAAEKLSDVELKDKIEVEAEKTTGA